MAYIYLTYSNNFPESDNLSFLCKKDQTTFITQRNINTLWLHTDLKDFSAMTPRNSVLFHLIMYDNQENTIATEALFSIFHLRSLDQAFATSLFVTNPNSFHFSSVKRWWKKTFLVLPTWILQLPFQTATFNWQRSAPPEARSKKATWGALPPTWQAPGSTQAWTAVLAQHLS